MNNWKETTLGELSKIKGGKRLPKGSSLVSYKTKHPYIRITDIENNKIKKNQLLFVTDEIFSSISKYTVNSRDIILSIVGSIGFVSEIDNDLDGASLTENCVKFVDLNGLDSKFLYYFLISSIGQGEIEKNAVGAVQKKLPLYGVQSISILLPSIEEQKEIAGILSSLDEKIELLREENKTLEETAQTIFKEWFVNFNFLDENGKPYKSTGGKMIDSELGKIPKDWKIGTVKDVIKKYSVSYRCDKEDLDSRGKTPIFDQGSNGLYGYTSREADFQASTENPVILFTNHTCNMWFVNYPFCAIQNVLPFRGNEDYSSFFVFYMTLKQIPFIEYKGHWPDFEHKKYVIPVAYIANNFAELIKPIQYKIWNNNFQIQTLSITRDTLLPKLMRGKIKIQL